MNNTDIQVSPKDVDLLGGWKVNLKVNRDGLLYRYARTEYGFQKEFLHRLVAERILAEKNLPLTRSVRIYFRDEIKTNCTRENLVLADYAIQGRKSVRRKGKTSKYRGVYRDRDRWHVKFYLPVPNNNPKAKNKVHYKVEHLGFFPLDKEKEAARAYDKRLSEVYPDAVLNLPEERVLVS